MTFFYHTGKRLTRMSHDILLAYGKAFDKDVTRHSFSVRESVWRSARLSHDVQRTVKIDRFLARNCGRVYNL